MDFYESERLELKRSFTKDIRKEVVAFANSQGGDLYIGVDDNGQVHGLEDVDFVMQMVTNSLSDSIRPDITMFVGVERVDYKEKTLVKVQVEEGSNKPYYLVEKGLKPSGVFVRKGSSSSPASQEAIRQMIKISDGDKFEDNRSILQKLTFNFLEGEFERHELKLNEIQKENLGISTRDGVYSNLALLLSDQCMHTTKLALFKEEDKTVYRDRKEFTGSLLEQFSNLYSYLDYYNPLRSEIEGYRRIDKRGFPPEALREVLLNALVHRDYSFSGSTLIHIYSDRLEVISLGGLVPGLSLEAVLLGASQSRNEKLAAIFYRLELIESFGTGLAKIQASYEGSRLKPIFQQAQGVFKVTLPMLGQDKKRDEILEIRETDNKYKPVLELFLTKDLIRRSDVEEALGVGSSYAIRILRELQDKNLIVRVGGGRKTSYRKI